MLQNIGLCAHFSKQGDWAFRYAFHLARKNDLQFNIFHWLDTPYRYHRDLVYKDSERKDLVPVTEELIRQKEIELREYYDDILGDYTTVGFRLCEGAEEFELSRCLRRQEYDVLVIGYQKRGILFSSTTMETFAQRFRSPIVLVGPDRGDEYYLNDRAVEIVSELSLPDGKWKALSDESEISNSGVVNS
jgi:hypothetical protein